jgi:hypothetical protein
LEVPGSVASPALAADAGDAYELKFLLSGETADRVEAWARQRLTPDPHGVGGAYRTSTLYLDTPHLDVYYKSPGYRRSKYRLRRYGSEGVIHLEQKTRRGDRVRKRREVLPLAELPRLVAPDGAGTWFGQRVGARAFRPVCRVGSLRTAFVTTTSGGPVRLTLDREMRGSAASDWTVPDRVEGRTLLPGAVVLELKFRAALPALFRELLDLLTVRAAGASKYGRCVEAWGLARPGR